MNPLVTSLIASSRHRLSPYPRFTIPLASNTIPSNDSITSTFSRNSTATYIDNDGILQTAGIDVPRFQNGRYLCEAAATNLSLYSESMDNWSLSSCTITPNTGVAPDGTLTADKATITGTYSHIHQLISGLTAGATYTFSVWLKNIDFNETIALYVSNSASTVSYLNSTITITDEWTRYSGSFTLPSDITTARVRALRTISETFGGSLLIWGVQLEAGTKATSYIPTTSAPVPRAADVLHYAVGDVITQGQGSLYCEFTTAQAGQVRYCFFLSDGTLSNSIYFRLDELNRVIVKGSIDGLYTLSVPVTPEALPYNKLGITFKTDSVILYLNGAVVGEDTLFTVPTTLNQLTVGCTVLGVYQLNSGVGNIKYFKEVLTPAEAIKITTI